MKKKQNKWKAYGVIIMLLMGVMVILSSITTIAEEPNPPLVITEIVNKSDGPGQPYEYVEIYNNSSEDIHLEGYQLQYFTSNMTIPANRWVIGDKTVKARDTLVLWLKKYNYPNVPLWDFNSNYDVVLPKEKVFEVELTTSGQGLHDSSRRQVGIASPDGNVISTAIINDGATDGITNKSIIYQIGTTNEMTRLRNNEQATPGKVISEQVNAPQTPLDISATPSNQAVTVQWEEIEGAELYNVYSNTSHEAVTVSEKSSITLEGLTNRQEYWFRVTAVDDEGNESPSSKEVTAIPQEDIDTESPAAPTGLQSSPGTDHVILKWDKSAASDFIGYRVYINGTLYSTTTTESIRVYPLELGRDYTFEVTTFDNAGNESTKTELVSGPRGNNPIPNLLITELVPNSDNFAGYDAFEYLEIYNNSAEPIDIKNYRISSGNWNVEITESLTIDPWDTQLFWTRVDEISPITREAFNHNYFSSYESKYLDEKHLKIIEGIGGLVNGGQTVTVIDSQGIEVVSANYSGDDVSVEKSITFSYPEDGGLAMEKLVGHQPTTPGWVTDDQVPPKTVQDEEAPQPPANLQANAGNGKVSLTWDPNPEKDIYRYHIYKNGSLEFSVPSTQNSFTLSLLMGNKDYRLELTAEDTSGNVSAVSNAVVATPTHQIITQEERTENPRDPNYQGLWDISEDGPVIPGLVQDIVPQGLTYYIKKDWLLAVNYLDDGRPGTLTVTEASSGNLVKSVLLYNQDGTPYTGHAGGITISKKHVWIASEQYLYPLKISDLVTAENNEEIRFINQIPVPVEAAYNVYDDGILWVGEFYEPNSYPTDPSHHKKNRLGEMQYAWMIGYDLERNHDMLSRDHWDGDLEQPATPDYILSTTGKVQGAIVQHKNITGITLSTSYGRGNDSLLYRYENPLKEDPHDYVTIGEKEVPLWFLDGKTAKPRQSIEAIPMPEGIVEVKNDLYVLFESGANKYRYTTTYPMDRMLKIDFRTLMKEDKTNY